MEAITFAAGGMVIYCGWITVVDEVRCWRNFRASCRKKTGKLSRFGQELFSASDNGSFTVKAVVFCTNAQGTAGRA